MNYVNRETGELLSYPEMKKQFYEDYDGDDDTNLITYDEIYMPVIYDSEQQRWLYIIDKTPTHFICSTCMNGSTRSLIYFPKMRVV